MSIAVEDIEAMFAENQIHGAQYFETRAAILSGQVVRVREALGTGILVFRSPKSGVNVELTFDDAGTPKLGTLRSGDWVEVTCPMIEEVLGQVVIGCVSVQVIEGGNTNGK